MILKDITEQGKTNGLMSYEQVKNIYLCHIPMTVENGLTTPTLKIKRIQVRNHFKDVVAQLYQDKNVQSKL